jgi:hypothetical protein
MSRGSVRVAAAGPPSDPGLLATFPPEDAAGSRPRAMASNRARCGPARPSASASSRAVSLRAVALIPRSRSLTDRGEMVAASARSSCVSPASTRSCRSSGPKLRAGPSATGASSPPQALRPLAATHPVEAASAQGLSSQAYKPATGPHRRWSKARESLRLSPQQPGPPLTAPSATASVRRGPVGLLWADMCGHTPHLLATVEPARSATRQPDHKAAR